MYEKWFLCDIFWIHWCFGILSWNTGCVWLRIKSTDYYQSYGPWSQNWFPLKTLHMHCYWQNPARLGLLGISLHQSIAELWPFTQVRNSINFVSFQYFENKLMKLYIFFICIDIDKIWVWIVMCRIAHFFKRVMALEKCYNFISSQYLKNWQKLAYALILMRYWLGLFCVKLRNLSQSYGPWLKSGFHLGSISLRITGWNLTKFCIHLDIDKI